MLLSFHFVSNKQWTIVNQSGKIVEVHYVTGDSYPWRLRESGKLFWDKAPGEFLERALKAQGVSYESFITLISDEYLHQNFKQPSTAPSLRLVH